MFTAKPSEVKIRLAMGMAAMVKLTKMCKNKAISTNTKLQLMNALVWPVATYGCEALDAKEGGGERDASKLLRTSALRSC